MKGILEGCVLSVIAKGETYGYEILSFLDNAGFSDLGEGTLYPVLTRLDKNGFISCRKAKSLMGPIRKYYSITDEGIKRLEGFIDFFATAKEKGLNVAKYANIINKMSGKNKHSLIWLLQGKSTFSWGFTFVRP